MIARDAAAARDTETGGDFWAADDMPEIETETLADCLRDIAGGMRTDCHGFWIPDAPC